MDRFIIRRKIGEIESQPSISSTSSRASQDSDSRQHAAAPTTTTTTTPTTSPNSSSSRNTSDPSQPCNLIIGKQRPAKRKASVLESDDSDTVDDDLIDEKNPKDIPSTSDPSDTEGPSFPKKRSHKKKEQSRKIKKAKRLFREVWGKTYPWITSKNNKPFCQVCQKSLEGGNFHLQRHEQTDFHVKRKAAASHTVAIDNLPKYNAQSKAATEAKSSALKLAMFIAEHNLSFRLLEHLPKLLKSVCPDSEIARQITCGRTKGQGLIVDVLGPESLKEAALKLQTAKFSLIIDETMDVSTSKCLAIVARYFDDEIKEIRDRCVGLVEVPCCTAAALHACIIEFLTLHMIPFENMIGFAADNASVMMGNLNGVQAKFRVSLPHLFVMGCACHSFHLCASAACLKLPRTIEDLARDIYSYFSHSTKRLGEFAGCQEIANLAPHRLLRPSQTRWLSLQAVVNRFLEQWPALILYFEKAVAEDNLQAAGTILNALKNPVYKVYFCFLHYILGLVTRLNLGFQSRESLLYSLLDRVTEVYRTILKNYLKPEYLAKTSTQSLDPGNIREYKAIEQLYCGARVEAVLSTSNVPPVDVRAFRLRVLEFYVELCREIRRRIKFDDPVLSSLSVLNPKVATSGDVASIIPLALHFPNLVSEESMEDLNSEWRLLSEVTELKNDTDNVTLVEFINRIGVIKNQAGSLMFPTLHTCIKALACLPHSSAAAERIFSQLNLMKTKTRNKLKVTTCNALLLTKELLHWEACYEWNPASKLLTKSARDLDSEDGE